MPTEFIHAPKCGRLIKKLERSNQNKHHDYVETQRGKNHEEKERDFHNNLEKITVMIAPISHARVSRFS